MNDATALVRRVEFKVTNQDDPLLAGFRRDGAFSIYLEAELAYHFDALGRLRRAYAHRLLYRTQGTTLASLERVRTPTSSELRRRDLSETELSAFLRELRDRLAEMLKSLETGQFIVTRQVPDDAMLIPQLAAALRSILAGELALAPPIPGKR